MKELSLSRGAVMPLINFMLYSFLLQEGKQPVISAMFASSFLVMSLSLIHQDCIALVFVIFGALGGPQGSKIEKK